jgi:hypothetical protein
MHCIYIETFSGSVLISFSVESHLKEKLNFLYMFTEIHLYMRHQLTDEVWMPWCEYLARLLFGLRFL